MSFDYDLVVIGSTPEGIYAARKAVLLQARVALVTQTEAERYLDCSSFIYSRLLNEITQCRNCWEKEADKTTSSVVSLAEFKSYFNLIRESIITEHSLDELAILGVDVIDGLGEFCRLPKQAFLVNNRRLQSRNYLLATGAKYQSEYREHSAKFNYLTPDDLYHKNPLELPQNLVIVGGTYHSLELAQGLARLGKQVTLVTSNQRLLPGEALATERLLQAQFAADRIEFILNSTIQQIKVIDNQTWLQIGDRALETEAIILTLKINLNIAGLNLDGVGVTSLFKHITVNRKLQTKNKSIYACGELLEANTLPHITQHQVDIALKNMFSFPWFKTDYRYLPIVIATQPEIARVGLANLPAQPNNSLYLIKQHYKSIMQAQITQSTTGWCQFIIQANGKILGCTIVGDRATELINIVAMMMRYRIKLSRNPIQGLLSQEITYVSPSFSDILNRVAIAFQQQRLQRDRSLRNRLETWFEWRR